MSDFQNVFACLVHEKPECILDLVRNLNYFDPDSKIILYNGGTNPNLFNHIPIQSFDVYIHPAPRPLKWGWLHDFALDCMEYAVELFHFNSLTIVDSDQLLIQSGFSQTIADCFMQEERIGMLTITENVQVEGNMSDPAKTAFKEKSDWIPFLKKLGYEEESFPYWTFWPSSVFSYEATKGLLHLFKENVDLKRLLSITQIWASEEILFPTLVKALGFKLKTNPSSYDYVQYKKQYDNSDVNRAISKPDCFWIHPIPRDYGQATRKNIREHFNHYVPKNEVIPIETKAIFSPLALLKKVENIQGWFSQTEAELLMGITLSLTSKKNPLTFVEIGSFQGKSTLVMAEVLKHLSPQSKVYAIDPHEGVVGARDQGIKTLSSTLEAFKRNITNNDLKKQVELLQEYSFNVQWSRPIDLLFIDGLHDYVNVARDFWHYQEWLSPNSYVLFHDYANYYPGVEAFVNELLISGDYKFIKLADSLIVLQRQNATIERTASQIIQTDKNTPFPLVTCIMPTANRSQWVAEAIKQFENQSYPNKELIILDDRSENRTRPIFQKDNIIYHQCEPSLSLGSKRNKACEIARGTIIIHWDDDDWRSKDWITVQVEVLEKSQSDVTGLINPYFFSPTEGKAWLYAYPEDRKPWVHGATLCYYKKLWERNPFPSIQIGEDVQFLWSSVVKKIIPHSKNQHFLAQIHPQNTSPKFTTSRNWQPIPITDLPVVDEIKKSIFKSSPKALINH